MIDLQTRILKICKLSFRKSMKSSSTFNWQRMDLKTLLLSEIQGQGRAHLSAMPWALRWSSKRRAFRHSQNFLSTTKTTITHLTSQWLATSRLQKPPSRDLTSILMIKSIFTTRQDTWAAKEKSLKSGTHMQIQKCSSKAKASGWSLWLVFLN